MQDFSMYLLAKIYQISLQVALSLNQAVRINIGKMVLLIDNVYETWLLIFKGTLITQLFDCLMLLFDIHWRPWFRNFPLCRWSHIICWLLWPRVVSCCQHVSYLAKFSEFVGFDWKWSGLYGISFLLCDFSRILNSRQFLFWVDICAVARICQSYRLLVFLNMNIIILWCNRSQITLIQLIYLIIIKKVINLLQYNLLTSSVMTWFSFDEAVRFLVVYTDASELCVSWDLVKAIKRCADIVWYLIWILFPFLLWSGKVTSASSKTCTGHGFFIFFQIRACFADFWQLINNDLTILDDIILLRSTIITRISLVFLCKYWFHGYYLRARHVLWIKYDILLPQILMAIISQLLIAVAESVAMGL